MATKTQQSKTRLKGITALVRRLRQQLESGTPQAALKVNQQAAGLLAAIEQMFSSGKVGPASLTPASARAVRQLKKMQAAALPRPARKAQKLRLSSGSVLHLTRHLEQIQAGLAQAAAGQPQPDRIQGEARRLVEQIELLCQAGGIDVGALNRPSLYGYNWLQFLSQEGVVSRHISALARFQKAAASLPQRQKVQIRPKFCNQTALYHYKAAGGVVEFQVNAGFIDAPAGVMQALALLALGSRTRKGRKLVWAYSCGAEYLSITRTLTKFVAGGQPGPEEIHLAELFARINARYFNNELQKPRLTWSSRSSQRVLGTYAPASDTIMISRALQAPEIPGFLLEYVLYHEMLHKALGTTLAGGVRRSHTAEFHRLEAQFVDFERAKAYLQSGGFSGKTLA